MSLHRKRAGTPLTALSIPQRLYLVPRLSVWLLPCMLVLLSQPSLADTILFNDLSEPVTVSVTDPSREVVDCRRTGYIEVTVTDRGTHRGVRWSALLNRFTVIVRTGSQTLARSGPPQSDLLRVDSEPTLAVVDFLSFDDGPPFSRIVQLRRGPLHRGDGWNTAGDWTALE